MTKIILLFFIFALGLMIFLGILNQETGIIDVTFGNESSPLMDLGTMIALPLTFLLMAITTRGEENDKDSSSN